jgi:hypothetical protein
MRHRVVVAALWEGERDDSLSGYDINQIHHTILILAASTKSIGHSAKNGWV